MAGRRSQRGRRAEAKGRERAMLIQFSYPLDEASVVMPSGVRGPELRPRSRMTPPPGSDAPADVRWNSYNNTSFVDAFVHTGTHVDTAFHVAKVGPKLGDFAIDDFVFEHPLLIEIAKRDEEEILVEDLRPYEKQLQQADLLLVHTGFSRYRKTDPERYMMKQPGFSLAAAQYLVKQPRLRCTGADTMGIENIPRGRAATPPFPVHTAFMLSGRKFLVLEDPNTEPLVGRKLSRAFVIPLLFPEAEAMMVTAFAEAA
ncbi:MAG: cyclase family protein [Candidatus Bipolaricaulota bacterium]